MRARWEPKQVLSVHSPGGFSPAVLEKDVFSTQCHSVQPLLLSAGHFSWALPLLPLPRGWPCLVLDHLSLLTDPWGHVTHHRPFSHAAFKLTNRKKCPEIHWGMEEDRGGGYHQKKKKLQVLKSPERIRNKLWEAERSNQKRQEMKEKHEEHLLGSVFYTFSIVCVEAKLVRKTTATQRISTKRCLEQCLWSPPSSLSLASALPSHASALRLLLGRDASS